MSEYIPEYINPLSVTYLADRKEIVISGFEKMESMTIDDVVGENFLHPGDIMLTDDDGDVVGYVCLLKYFQ